MAKKEVALTVQQIAQQRRWLAVLNPLRPAVENLTIHDEPSFTQADGLLAKLQGAATDWDREMEDMIRPISDGLQKLYAHKRRVSVPFETAIKMVRDKMTTYRRLEADRVRQAQLTHDREVERLRLEAEAQERKLLAAKTPQMKARLANAQAALEVKADNLQWSGPADKAVNVENSTVSHTLAWEVSDDDAFVSAVADGTLPRTCLMINHAEMNRLFKADPEGFRAWPGIRVFHDVQIRRRAGR